MISRATIFWLIALAGMVLMTVTVSLKVNRISASIDKISAEKSAVQQRIALLDASYQLLISSERLTPLADQHLDLVEVRGDQLLPLKRLPTRIPLPTARAPEPQRHQPGQNLLGQQDTLPTDQPPQMPPPTLSEPPSGTPPWLQAQGRNALQPVSLQTPQGRSQ
jgi:hypothetical protein